MNDNTPSVKKMGCGLYIREWDHGNICNAKINIRHDLEG